MSLKLIKLQRVVEEFRKLDPEMQAQTMLAFMFCAEKEESGTPATVKEVGNYLEVTSASASRNIAALCEVSRHRRPGHNLLATYENPEYRVEKLIKLTDKGKNFVKKLEGYI